MEAICHKLVSAAPGRMTYPIVTVRELAGSMELDGPVGLHCAAPPLVPSMSILPAPPMLPLMVAFALLIALSAVIVVVQRRSGVGRAAATSGERHSSRVLGMAHLACLASAVVFPTLQVGSLAVGEWVGWLAIALMVAGFSLQLWAVRALGRWYNFTLTSERTQPLVERGPYRLLRHPGYLGQIVFFFAFALAALNLWTLVVALVALAVGYGYRIRTEERLMAGALGERWRAYACGRARLLPWIF